MKEREKIKLPFSFFLSSVVHLVQYKPTFFGGMEEGGGGYRPNQQTEDTAAVFVCPSPGLIPIPPSSPQSNFPSRLSRRSRRGREGERETDCGRGGEKKRCGILRSTSHSPTHIIRSSEESKGFSSPVRKPEEVLCLLFLPLHEDCEEICASGIKERLAVAAVLAFVRQVPRQGTSTQYVSIFACHVQCILRPCFSVRSDRT